MFSTLRHQIIPAVHDKNDQMIWPLLWTVERATDLCKPWRKDIYHWQDTAMSLDECASRLILPSSVDHSEIASLKSPLCAKRWLVLWWLEDSVIMSVDISKISKVKYLSVSRLTSYRLCLSKRAMSGCSSNRPKSIFIVQQFVVWCEPALDESTKILRSSLEPRDRRSIRRMKRT